MATCGWSTAAVDAETFIATALLGARAVGPALADAAHLPDLGLGADGAITHGADALAEQIMVGHLVALGVPIVSEERGVIGGPVPAHGAWICLDPLDGSRNHRAGTPPYATAVALLDGREPIAGLVREHGSGVTWSAVRGSGAGRFGDDGRGAEPVVARPGELVAVPSVGPGESAPALPPWCTRVRMSGCTTVDLCRVADGSHAAFADLRRAVVHPHDLAAPLVVLREAGAAVVDPDSAAAPDVTPDPGHTRRLVAAWSAEAAAEVLAAARAVR